MNSTTQFKKNDILYKISITYYSNEAKDPKEFEAYDRELAEFMVNAILN